MELRISELSSGEFIIQRRCFFFWWVLATNVTHRVSFSDYHEARHVAVIYKNGQKYGPGVVQSWRV